MKHFLSILAMLMIPVTSSASANWRWASPKLKPRKISFSCSDLKCLRKAYRHERRIIKARIKIYNKNRAKEWRYWIRRPIVDCTWAGESSPPGDYTGKFARYRYLVSNAAGSGAYGKYQMMPGTYFTYAKYRDWSPLDQEIAAHRLYASSGTGPWQAC